MKRMMSILLVCAGMTVAIAAEAQKIDEQRMERDIEIGENVLSTLIKQQMNKRNFFPYDVEGSYTPGFGVTFRLPMDLGGPMMYIMAGESGSKMSYGEGYTFTVPATPEPECEDCPPTAPRAKARAGKSVTVRKMAKDSTYAAFNEKVIEASRNFIADYGDLITQLGPDEKILITNRHEGQRFYYAGNMPRRKFLSLEATKVDLTQYKQGKLTRDQFMAKLSVIDSENSEEMAPDFELLSSIFDRLYRSDLSKTYYSQEGIYYERLKNYGVIYYMQVYSSNETDYRKFNMPTQALEDIDKPTRDKKVTELYPAFETDIKESMLDYGRTLKSLKDDEVLAFNIKLTKCEGCGIPRTLELSIKYNVLKEYASGRLNKDAALGRITVKKGPAQ